MLKVIILPVLFFAAFDFGYAQPKPIYEWERSLDSGWSASVLSVTPSGDILASGSSSYVNLLARLSNKGEILWTLPSGSNQYGDTFAIETMYVDEYQGKTRLFGRRVHDIFFRSGWLIRWEINSQGELKQWCCDWKIAQQTYGNPITILPTNDRGMYLCGTVNGGGVKEDFDKVFFTKTDSTGFEILKVYNDVKADTGSALVSVRSFVRMPDGGFVIAGNIQYLKPGGAIDVFILRIDSLGNKLWTKNYGTTSAEGAVKVIATKDSGFLLTCNSQHFGTGKNYAVYCIKTDSMGTVEWERSYLEPDYFSNFPLDCIQTKDNNFIVVGRINGGDSNSDGFILKIDTTGKKQWSYIFGSLGLFDFLASIAELPNGNFIVGGLNNGKMYVAEISFPVLGIDSPDVTEAGLFLTASQHQTGETIIRYSTHSTSSLSLVLYNSMGSEIQRLSSEAEKKGGEYSITLPSDKLPSGVFFLRLSDGKTSIIKPLTITR